MTKTTTREDLTDAVRNKSNLTSPEARAMVDQIFELIGSALITDGQAKLSRFGTFTKLSKTERLGRNPKTGKTAVVSARNTVSFYPSKMMIKKVNNKTR